MTDKILKEYYGKLAKEGWLKSLLCGLIVGFIAMFISSMVFWLTVAKYFWVAILIWVGVTGVAVPIFYACCFKPNPRQVARRVDDLGLEERLLTMTQLEGNDSYIAIKQREDALAALNKINASLLKFAISIPLIVLPCVAFVFGAGMTTITGLAANGVIKGGNELLEEITKEPPVEYEIAYEAGEGGMIEGDIFQVVIKGGDAMGVMAVPDEEYIFVEWSDGLKNPYREDKNVSKSFIVTATFQYVEDGGDESDEGEGEEATDQPKEPGEGDGEGEPGDPTEEKPSDEAQAGVRKEPQNYIRDGETYYGDEFEEAFKDVLEEVSQEGELSGDEKDIIDDYFGAIRN